MTQSEAQRAAVAWLGPVPATWDIVKVGRVASTQGGVGFPHEYQGVADAPIPFYKVSDMNAQGNEIRLHGSANSVSLGTAERLGGKIVEPGAIVFPKVGAAMLTNKRRLLAGPSIFDNNMMALIPRRGVTKYWYYLLTLLDLERISNPGPVPSVNEGQVKETRIPFPTDAEQKAIADFLDRETERIDRLMEKKRRLIELLEEKLTALISHAVTKGLNSSVPMKDSEIPWLGEIPAHWEALPIRRVAHYGNSNVDKKTVEGEIPIRLCNYTDVYYGSYLDNTEGFMEATATPDEVRKFRLRAGTVLVTKDSETADDIGIPAYVSKDLDAVCGYHLTVLDPNPRSMRGDYLYWALESSASRAGFETVAKGVTRFGLTLEGIGSTVVTVPPLDEQRDIALRLREHDALSNRIVVTIQSQLDKLAEYRQALITAAVTGQIDVTGEAPEPEEVVA